MKNKLNMNQHGRRAFLRSSLLSALGVSAVAAGFRLPAYAAEEEILECCNCEIDIDETTLDDFNEETCDM